jgi:hypothetical protein
VSSAARRFIIRSFEVVRSTWMVIGTTLLLLVLLEGGIRVRRAMSERPPAAAQVFVEGNPNAEAWVADWRRDFDATRKLAWRPYVYFRRAPASSPEIVIDSSGHRVTPQPSEPMTPVARVRLYGGSTMWGEPLRANHTIPAEVARRMQPLAGAGARIDVTNVGETGYVFTQEVLQLILDLRAGLRPDVVMFYDGINDVAATVQRGMAGDPQNEFRRVAEFNFGRSLESSGSETTMQRDRRALGVLGGQLFGRLAIVQWARAQKSVPPRTYVSADSATESMVHVYVETARMVELLAAKYGFIPVYVWQPNIHGTEKKLNAHEKQLRDLIEADDFHKRVQDIHRLVPPLLDSAMRSVAPGRFINAAGMFRNDAQAVFIDRIGHNTEASIPVIVDSFWPALAQAASQALAKRTGAAGQK